MLAQPQKMSPDLGNLKPGTKVDVIIQFVNPAEENDRGNVEKIGGQKRADLQAINGALYSVPVNALARLAKNPNIRYVSPDRGIRPRLDYATPTVYADIAANYGWTGKGVGIALIDSGVQNHADLCGRIVYSESFVPGVRKAEDQFGHGTHVAGIAAGNGRTLIWSPAPPRGVAAEAHIVNLRVLDGNGAGTESGVIAAIDRAIALRDTYNIRVMNLSLGRGVYESYALDPLCKAVETAWNAGIVVVVAAGNQGRDNTFGNEGYGTIGSPGNDPYVITVGAMKTRSTVTRADDAIASYSSQGPSVLDHFVKPDIVAPGNRTISLLARKSSLPDKYPDNAVPLSYFLRL